jgi:phosphoglycolate phosphatase-like HAD superfamily hydrolase
VKASQKAGIDCAAVTWGFNSRESLLRSNPKYVIDEPSELLAMILAR